MTFELIPFSDCALDDRFFDTLKEDYPGFSGWFEKKSDKGEKAYVWKENGRIHGFLYVKNEPEIEAVGDLPEEPRLKIGTLKIDDEVGGQRIGEGAIGIALWEWKRSGLDQVYVTIYPKHESLIRLMKDFGFRHVTDKGKEHVYLKDRRTMDGDYPKQYFPFIDLTKGRGKILPIEEDFHDKMFPYSELRNTDQVTEQMPVSNGVTKIYLASPPKNPDYRIYDVAFVYRMAKEDKRWKSVISSYCTVEAVMQVKVNGNAKMKKEEFFKRVGNKTVYTQEELEVKYSGANLYIIELLYCGYFGAGNNVNLNRLRELEIWDDGKHPYQMMLDRDQEEILLKEGRLNVKDVAVH